MDDEKQNLLNILSAREAQLPSDLESVLYRRSKVRLGIVLKSMGRLSQARGAAAFFIDGHASQLKQHFHVASKLRAASVGEDGGEDFGTHSLFLYGLLSDSPEVIEWLGSVEAPQLVNERDNPSLPWFYSHMIQLALTDQHDALRAKIEHASRKGQAHLRKDFASGQDFYSLFLRRDKTALEALLSRHARKHEGDPILENFLAEGSTLRAKLCWLKGIPVHVNSPLIPMELMPIQPLPRYDDEYDFLRPDWVPPPQGIWGRAARWWTRQKT